MNEIINWLLSGDPSIQKMAQRDLLDSLEYEALSKDQLKKGWGHMYLQAQNENKHWGGKFYYPKWKCTHYTLVELRNLNMPILPTIQEAIELILHESISIDGGVNPNIKEQSDVCINGMFLNYACYFHIKEEKLISVIDYILNLHMKDGGYNCRLTRSGAHHSSMHTTISVLEGFASYLDNDYAYRKDEVLEQKKAAEEFLLKHHLYLSDHTGNIIQDNMTVMAYPTRWKYNFLRGLDYFRSVDYPYDIRMQEALDLLKSKQKSGYWNMQSKHPGQQFFIMEKGGQRSRINTLLALRVLKKYDVAYYNTTVKK